MLHRLHRANHHRRRLGLPCSIRLLSTLHPKPRLIHVSCAASLEYAQAGRASTPSALACPACPACSSSTICADAWIAFCHRLRAERFVPVPCRARLLDQPIVTGAEPGPGPAALPDATLSESPATLPSGPGPLGPSPDSSVLRRSSFWSPDTFARSGIALGTPGVRTSSVHTTGSGQSRAASARADGAHMTRWWDMEYEARFACSSRALIGVQAPGRGRPNAHRRAGASPSSPSLLGRGSVPGVAKYDLVSARASSGAWSPLPMSALGSRGI